MADDCEAAIKRVTLEEKPQRMISQCTEQVDDTYYDERKDACYNDDEYDFSHKRRGVAVVIINDSVTGEEKRRGSELDMKYFQGMFSHLGFSVRAYQDKTSSELMAELNAISKEDHSDCDCFALAVSTHGAEYFNKLPSEKDRVREDTLYTKDGTIKVRMILDMFADDKCPTLVKKPRLFFLQACRGEKLDDGLETPLKVAKRRPAGTDVTDSRPSHSQPEEAGSVLEEPRTASDGIPYVVKPRVQETRVKKVPKMDISPGPTSQHSQMTAAPGRTSQSKVDVCPAPCYKDFLVMYATPPGYYAFRRTTEGSWFVKSLAEVLSHSKGERCLSQELTQVLGKVAFDFMSKGSLADKKQSPVIYSMLTKDVYFRPKV